MTRSKLLLIFGVILLILSIISAFVLKSIPEEMFKEEKFKFVVGLIGTLFIASLTGILGYYLSRFTDRPILSIEHVNFKSERKPFSLPKELWHFITHSDSVIEYIDKRVNWSMICFDKNEFQYYHLNDINRFVKIFIARYKATANWTQTMIDLIKEYKKDTNSVNKKNIVNKLHPYLYKFEDHYHSAFNSGIYHDLKTNPEKVIEFIESESQGLLNAHNKSIEDMSNIITWTNRIIFHTVYIHSYFCNV